MAPPNPSLLKLLKLDMLTLTVDPSKDWITPPSSFEKQPAKDELAMEREDPWIFKEEF